MGVTSSAFISLSVEDTKKKRTSSVKIFLMVKIIDDIKIFIGKGLNDKRISW